MTLGSHATLAAVATVAGLSLALALQARAGGDKVAFPQDYAKGALYDTVDRPDNKQYRELYVTPPSALDAAKKGEPLPSGTVLTMVQYAAKLDAAGNPEKDANGRFIKSQGRRLYGDGEAHRLGRRVPREPAQRRMGIPGLPARQDSQTERQPRPTASTATSRSATRSTSCSRTTGSSRRRNRRGSRGKRREADLLRSGRAGKAARSAARCGS